LRSVDDASYRQMSSYFGRLRQKFSATWFLGCYCEFAISPNILLDHVRGFELPR
jgi:hypothetical protein